MLGTVDEFGEPAGQLDVATVDVVERHGVVDPRLVVLHRDAEQQSVDGARHVP